MKKARSLVVLLVCILTVPVFSQEEMPEIIKVGDSAPEFTLHTLDGALIDSKAFKGKVVYINFFATWCGPCMKEMPHVEKEIWQGIKHNDFIMVAIGREHTKKEMQVFKDKKGLTLPIAADSTRIIYSKFAPQMIPRNIVIDKDGKIAYSKHGFDEKEFDSMVRLIQTLLEK